MPGVLTNDGWVVFNTQEEANAFRAKMEAEGKIEEEAILPMDGEIPDKDVTAVKMEAEDESPTGFMRNIKKRLGRRN